MKLAEIEERLQQIDITAGQDLIFELLAAYDIPKASITKLRSGSYNRSGDDDTVLWKKKVWDTYTSGDDDSLLSLLDRAQANSDIRVLKPRFFIARNERRLAAVDSRLGDTLDISLKDLARHASFFMPLAGAEKVQSETATYVDTKVAAQMARLYDEIVVTNPEQLADDDGRRELNVFFSRVLFCFFAEDTGVFPDGVFTHALNNLTAIDGTDMASFLDQLFDVLDTPLDQRAEVPSHFEPFGYVNGSLFTDKIDSPAFSRKARNIVVDCGALDWSSINPDIFGSMIQAVVSTDDRANLGMHYTSVENILKVLNPLFLDDLEERFNDASMPGSVSKLQKLLDHLGEIKVFDPACGSGNFLIVAYKRLRSLEHRILVRLGELDSAKVALFADSKISLENFYGIEIDDFAHDIAKLSLWLAKHQMNTEYDELFGIERPLIPLTESGNIICENATRVNWIDICAPSGTTFVCGNPPYLGARLQSAKHKDDFEDFFGTKKYPRDFDYISIWFLKVVDWLSGEAKAAFVSTNSVCQGAHVGLLWPLILNESVHIVFAHTSFLWGNNAKGSAGVTCVVVGLSKDQSNDRRLFDTDKEQTFSNINPYLVGSDDNTIVKISRRPLGHRPKMVFGSRPIDGGNLLLSEFERGALLSESPGADEYLREYVGTDELLDGVRRYCLWVSNDNAESALEYSSIARRVLSVAAFRKGGDEEKKPPYRFGRAPHQDLPAVVVPATSSERRTYIPIAMAGPTQVTSNSLYVAYGAETWLFSILHSSMHMAWVRTVGGRLESRYRYSNTLCYNTFPFPELSQGAETALSDRAFEILASREQWPDRSLAELYDPVKMPANLRAAHEANDAYVGSLYRRKPFNSDAERMELLLAMYRDLVIENDTVKSKKTENAKKG